MEFIPLEKYSSKNKKRESVKKEKGGKRRKIKEDEANVPVVKETKLKPQTKIYPKKNVKNKYKETLALKQKNRVPKKRTKKGKREEEEDEEEEEEEIDDQIVNEEEEMSVDEAEEDSNEEQDDDDEDEDEDEEDEDKDEEAFKRKCKEMDEKKSKRLFVKLKKKIVSESQVKELHPDIQSVIFPRKKMARWCWIVFSTEEKANKALTKLKQVKDITVSKPKPYAKVDQRNKEKMKTVLRKKQGRKKLQNMWM